MEIEGVQGDLISWLGNRKFGSFQDRRSGAATY